MTMHSLPDELDEQSQRDSQIVRDALQHYPTLQSAPEFDARVLERVLNNAPTSQHLWKDIAPTRSEQRRLCFAQHLLRLEKRISISPRNRMMLCAALGIVLLVLTWRVTSSTVQNWARSSNASENAPTQLRTRNAESSPVLPMPEKRTSP